METIDIITAEELASLLETNVSPGLTLVVDLVNETITEAWLDPVDPVPARVRALAFAVGARAGANPKGLTSWTRGWDDITRTERMEATRRLGVYLDDGDLAELNGTLDPTAGVRSIQTRVADRPKLGHWPC